MDWVCSGDIVMKAVMPVATEDVLALRKRTGADQWDEMWKGVLHMPPMPVNEHQDLAGDLQTYVKIHRARPRRAKVLHEVNLASIGGWPDDYRIPDLLLLTRDRFAINRGKYFEGAPNLVVEIRSPGDETYEKLDFYAELGVPEVWVIHGTTKVPEIYLLRRGRYRKMRADSGGWLRSPATGNELRKGKAGKLSVRLAGDDTTREELPED
jgi:Uma2 family endonuclease